MPPESGLARAVARPRAAKMQFYYLFHLRSCAAATAGCCGSAYCGGSRTVFVQSLLETLFLNLFTSVFVYGFRILLLVALVLAFAFCASYVPTYVYLAAAPTINAVVLPLLTRTGAGLSSSCKRRRRSEAYKRGRPKEKEDDHEEAARYQMDGGKVLEEKWVGLCVRDDEYRFTGEIVGMKWVDDTEPPQICAEIRSYDKKVTETYCVLDLPAMVIAAEDEQLLDVLLEYDPPEDEFDLPGDGEAENAVVHLSPSLTPRNPTPRRRRRA